MRNLILRGCTNVNSCGRNSNGPYCMQNQIMKERRAAAKRAALRPLPNWKRAALASKGQVRTRVITQKKKTTDTRNNESSCVRPEDGLHQVPHTYLTSGRCLKSPVRNYMQMDRYRRAVWRIRDLIRMFRANPEVQKFIPIP